jgi:hypothetical protein
VGLGGTGGNLANHFASSRINDVKSVGQFRADVEHAVRSELGAMRTNGFSKIDDLDVAAFLQVNDVNGAAVGAGLTDAGISVNGNVTEVMARGYSDFVAVNVYADFVYNFSRIEVHHESGVISLIGQK